MTFAAKWLEHLVTDPDMPDDCVDVWCESQGGRWRRFRIVGEHPVEVPCPRFSRGKAPATEPYPSPLLAASRAEVLSFLESERLRYLERPCQLSPHGVCQDLARRLREEWGMESS